MSEILFSSSGKRLHGDYHHIKGATSVALILPPHPRFGATMNNKMTVNLYNCFVKNNFSTLRMNYSGVGSSEGKVSDKDSELIKDANAAIEWLQSHHPLVDYFWVGGFSSGAWLALNLVMRRPEISSFVAVSLPLKLHDFSFLIPCTVPGIIIQGTNDSLCDINELSKLTSLIRKRVKHFNLQFIENGDYKMSSKENLEAVFSHTNKYLSNIGDYISEGAHEESISLHPEQVFEEEYADLEGELQDA